MDVDETAWRLIEEVAEVGMTTTKAVVHGLLMECQAALTRTNSTVRLPSTWPIAAARLQQRLAAEELSQEAETIDASVLELDAKNPSGFRHVYVHARGFTAQGRDPFTRKPGKHLGLFQTALQAAWARYQHYRSHKLPYGKLEEEIEKLRAQPQYRETSEHWVKALAISHLAHKGIICPDLTPDERRWETADPLWEMD